MIGSKAVSQKEYVNGYGMFLLAILITDPRGYTLQVYYTFI